MESKQELSNIRIKLQNEMDFHKKEMNRISEALKALDTVESLLGQNGRQITMPEASPYEHLGPDELVLTVLNSSGREWTMKEILAEAEQGGKNLSKWSNPYNVLYVAAKRLVQKGQIQAIRDKEKPNSPVKYKRLSV